jgi:hypothetical protein
LKLSILSPQYERDIMANPGHNTSDLGCRTHSWSGIAQENFDDFPDIPDICPMPMETDWSRGIAALRSIAKNDWKMWFLIAFIAAGTYYWFR